MGKLAGSLGNQGFVRADKIGGTKGDTVAGYTNHKDEESRTTSLLAEQLQKALGQAEKDK